LLKDAVKTQLVAKIYSKAQQKKTVIDVSRREKEVLDLIAEELTPRQIAEKLCISEKRLRDTARIYWLSFR
tara:strand:- start:47340 stop:47552 length:213 start_codon:yes stop_codon:yes gene_type:complete